MAPRVSTGAMAADEIVGAIPVNPVAGKVAATVSPPIGFFHALASGPCF